MVIHNQDSVSRFTLQHDVHASRKPRLQTNIWNFSELEVDRVAVSRSMKRIGHGSLIQVVARGYGQGWVNEVKFVRVGIHGQEINVGKSLAVSQVEV